MVAVKEPSKWKDYLLKSGLPLEHIVSEGLGRRGFAIDGEYRYTRLNEKEIPTDFSVDLHARTYLPDTYESSVYFWATISLLVECKYHHAGVRWVFARCPKRSSLYRGRYVSVIEELTTNRIRNTAPLARFEEGLPICNRGVELHASGCESKNIDQGLYQLRYAIPSLIAQETRNQVGESDEKGPLIIFLCPLLVTTASIHVLNEGIVLEAIEKAESLGEVSREVDALVSYQEPAPGLLEHITQVLRRLHTNVPEIRERLEQARKILSPSGEEGTDLDDWGYVGKCIDATKRVVVLRFDAFDRIISDLFHAVEEVATSRIRVARLSVDVASRTRRLVALSEEDRQQ